MKMEIFTNDSIDPLVEEVLDEAFGKASLPAIYSPLRALFGEYEKKREQIARVASFVRDECTVFEYFSRGAEQTHNQSSISAPRLFDEEAGARALDCDFWGRALALTDVFDYMPAKRRNEWRAQMRTGFLETTEMVETRFGWESRKKNQPIPAFTEETVKLTLQTMLASRQQFFAERVDGLWRSLSQTHLTNQPEGFSKRMIINRVINYYGHLDYDMAGYIHDLRSIIARFMGRDEPHHTVTNSALDDIVTKVMRGNGSGKWHVFDGGSWQIRMYKIGTAHLLVHPDMAWRLNAILASMHPMAIPSQFRQKPKKEKRVAPLVHDLVPFEVLAELGRAKYDHPGKNVSFYVTGKASDRLASLMEYLGGVKTLLHTWSFSYNVQPAIEEICATGRLPDRVAFQYYPTPSHLAEEAVALADIGEDDECLEPSVGQGAIASFMPPDRTTCVELSSLHCAVVESKGFKVINTDFLEWSPDQHFSKIVMNPPFADGRAEAHLLKAASLLTTTGTLVAILPAGMKDKILVEGRKHEYSSVRANEFKGASVSVVLLKLT